MRNVDLDTLGLFPGDRLVDVGCGTGSLAKQMVRSGLHVTGVEPEAYLRARFDRRVTALDPGSRSVEGPVDRLPFADGELAGVVMTEVLEHVDDPVAALAELRRVMDLDGLLCLSVPTSYTGLLYWRLHPRCADNATHERIFTKPELRRLIERAGFEIVRWEGRNFLPAGSWVFHSLLRRRSDHTRAIEQHQVVDRVLGLLWKALSVLRIQSLVGRAGNRVWAKSWYVYCRPV